MRLGGKGCVLNEFDTREPNGCIHVFAENVR